MSEELIGIITAAIALAGLNLFQFRAIRSELREAARDRLELRDRIAQIEVSLSERLGRIEGRLDELREFFFRSGGTAA